MEKSSTSSDVLSSIPRLLARNVRQYGDRPAYREKEYGIWQSWTWAEAAQQIEWLALGFLALGMERGDHVAIIGRNRPDHYWAMIAAQMCGAVPVPLYQDAVAEEMAYVLGHCGARFGVDGTAWSGSPSPARAMRAHERPCMNSSRRVAVICSN